MQHIRNRWADTQMAIEPGRSYSMGGMQEGDDFATPPEAAHAASELDADHGDTRPIPGAGPITWLVFGVVGMLLGAGAWHMVARWSLL